MLFGAGFIVTPEEAAKLEADAPIKPYRNGRDLTDRPRGVIVTDRPVRLSRRRSAPPLAGDLSVGAGTRQSRSATTIVTKPSTKTGGCMAGRPAIRAALARFVALHRHGRNREASRLPVSDARIAPDNKLIASRSTMLFSWCAVEPRTHACWALALVAARRRQ
jgi:hypothetical protein